MLSLFKFKQNRGFSLVEMLVVIVIFLIITGIIVANYPQFKDQSALELMAQEMAVNIRTAQVLGTGTRVGSSGPAAARSYGVHFNSDNTNKFISFIGSNKEDGTFDEGDKIVEEYTLQGADITNFYDQSGDDLTGVFDITYRRPNPEARILHNNSNITGDSLTIKIKSKRGGDRCKQIRISINGQIAVIPGFQCQQ
ncbi:MAG: prepilin-type N-terminal cleavage/methylation domain-containing protein [Candidatus Vogelbacteria bacterium]|nr:prepilin-type N-terminal cleavage/methylation domain-containing protein [Candidatus Vogelbacteria bacterium]